MMTIKSLW